MPLYIKLDINRSGLIDAYVDTKPSWDGISPKACGSTVSQTLRDLAATTVIKKEQ